MNTAKAHRNSQGHLSIASYDTNSILARSGVSVIFFGDCPMLVVSFALVQPQRGNLNAATSTATFVQAWKLVDIVATVAKDIPRNAVEDAV